VKTSEVKFGNEDLKIGDIILFAGNYYIVSLQDSLQDYGKSIFLYNIDTSRNEEDFNDINELMEYLQDHEIVKVKSLRIGE
jgi:hypothetical protein